MDHMNIQYLPVLTNPWQRVKKTITFSLYKQVLLCTFVENCMKHFSGNFLK